MMDLEKLSIELRDEFLQERYAGKAWKRLARLFLKKMIEAKIEILREILTGPDWSTRERIAELEAEKNELEK